MSEIENIPKEVIAKIQKLIKLEESAKTVGNLEEAANAGAKIRDILMKHNLDLYKVQQAGDHTQKKEPISQKSYNPEDLTRPHEGGWVSLMVRALGTTYLCKVIGRPGFDNGKSVWIVGTASNVEILWYTVEQLCNRIRPIAREEFKKYKGKEKRNTYFRGFYVGAVNGIRDRLALDAQREVWKAQQAEKEKRNGNVVTDAENTSLMVIAMQVEHFRDIDRHCEATMNLGYTNSKGPSYKGVSGKVAGYETGKSMGINSGVGSGVRPGIKRLG